MEMVNEKGKIVKDSEKVNKGFLFSYALAGGGGFMMLQAVIGSYFSIFMTDTFGIPAGILSVIVLVASIWDAINDPMMGSIADFTKTRWGRYRPYFVIPPVLLTIAAYFLFLNPQGLSVNQKIIYCSVFYVLFQMLVTVCTMPQMAILPACVKSTEVRTKAITLGMISNAVAFTIATSFNTQLTNFFGGYANLMLVYGIIAIFSFWGLFKFSKEKYLTSLGNRTILTDMKTLFKRKELFSILVTWFMVSLGYGLMFAASVYYMMYYMARPDKISSYMFTVSMGALFSMVVAMPICLKLFKTPKKTLIVTQFISIVCYALLFFFGNKSMTILYVLSFLAAFFSSMQLGIINIFLNDAIDYIMLRDNISLNGTLSAIKGFSFKLGGAVTNSSILAVLGFTGYIAGAVGHQPPATLFAINVMRFLVPILASGVIIFCMFIYPIEKYFPQIEEMKNRMENK